MLKKQCCSMMDFQTLWKIKHGNPRDMIIIHANKPGNTNLSHTEENYHFQLNENETLHFSRVKW